MSKKKNTSTSSQKQPELKQVENLVLEGDYAGARKAISRLPDELKSDALVHDAFSKINIEKTVLSVSVATICVVLMVLFFTHSFHTH